MGIDRRRLFAAMAGAGAIGAASDARSTPVRDAGPRAEIDAASLGIRPNAADDQSQALQRAIEQAAAARAVLRLPPGFYRAGALQLPPYAAIAGVAGATRIVMAGGPSMMAATGSDHVGISNLVLDGAGIPLPERRGLLHVAQGRAVRIADCEIVNSGRNGIALEFGRGRSDGQHDQRRRRRYFLDRRARLENRRQHRARRRQWRHPGLAQRAG